MDNNLSHTISITERKNLVLTGIKKIINFSDKEFSIDSNMGSIIVKGSELEVIKLDTIDGNVTIKGNIDGINYLDQKSHNESLITKLFK